MGCTIDDADDTFDAVYDGLDTGGKSGARRGFIPAL